MDDDVRLYGPPTEPPGRPKLPTKICNGVRRVGVVNGVMGVIGVTVVDPPPERAGETIPEPMLPS